MQRPLDPSPLRRRASHGASVLALLVTGCSGAGVLATDAGSSSDAGSSDGGSTGAGLKIVKSPGAVYLGAYDWKENGQTPGVSEFETAIGKKVALYGFSCATAENTRFALDLNCLNDHASKGYVSHVDVVAREPGRLLSAQEVIDGDADAMLADVADALIAFDKPIFLAYAREPSIQGPLCYQSGQEYECGWGYGPSGDKKRNEVTDPWGQYVSARGDSCSTPNDRKCDDGRERYREMCRHIHDTIERLAPGRATWVMGAAAEFQPGSYASFYPGNDYVDWHAMDIYPEVYSPPAEGMAFDKIHDLVRLLAKVVTLEPGWASVSSH